MFGQAPESTAPKLHCHKDEQAEDEKTAFCMPSPRNIRIFQVVLNQKSKDSHAKIFNIFNDTT